MFGSSLGHHAFNTSRSRLRSRVDDTAVRPGGVARLRVQRGTRYLVEKGLLLPLLISMGPTGLLKVRSVTNSACKNVMEHVNRLLYTLMSHFSFCKMTKSPVGFTVYNVGQFPRPQSHAKTCSRAATPPPSPTRRCAATAAVPSATGQPALPATPSKSSSSPPPLPLSSQTGGEWPDEEGPCFKGKSKDKAFFFFGISAFQMWQKFLSGNEKRLQIASNLPQPSSKKYNTITVSSNSRPIC